jgi:hypothetical protein
MQHGKTEDGEWLTRNDGGSAMGAIAFKNWIHISHNR